MASPVLLDYGLAVGLPPQPALPLADSLNLFDGVGFGYGYALHDAKTFVDAANFLINVFQFSLNEMMAMSDLMLWETNLTITTNSLPQAAVGESYSATLTADGGNPPYTWSLFSGSLPDGLSLSSDGVISGTPTTAETSNFTVEVTDTAGGHMRLAVTM